MRKIKDVQKNIMLYVLNTVAKINTYNWDDDFKIEQVEEVYDKVIEFFRNEVEIDLNNEEQLKMLGFQRWNDETELFLIPLWAYDLVPDGTKMHSIFDETVEKGEEEIDKDIRLGCLAYGIVPDVPDKAKEK